MRVVNDGTNITFLVSRLGFDWVQIAQISVTAAGSPDRVGFFANANDNKAIGTAGLVSLLDWEVLNTASPNAAAINARM